MRSTSTDTNFHLKQHSILRFTNTELSALEHQCERGQIARHELQVARCGDSVLLARNDALNPIVARRHVDTAPELSSGEGVCSRRIRRRAEVRCRDWSPPRQTR